MHGLHEGEDVVGYMGIDADTVLTSVEDEFWVDDDVVMLEADDEMDEAEQDVEEEHTDLGDTDGIL